MKVGAFILWAALAILFGLFVLLGYFVDLAVIRDLRDLFMRWAMLLSAAALILGLINLLAVHLHRVNAQEAGWPHSALLIMFLLVTLVLGVFFGADNKVVLSLFDYIQLPVEASLMALLAVSLAVAGFRLVSRRRDFFSLVFIGSAFLVLLGTAPWPIGAGSVLQEAMSQLRLWVAQVWAAGGARGVLLGVALGAITTGLRVLLAADRPYGD